MSHGPFVPEAQAPAAAWRPPCSLSGDIAIAHIEGIVVNFSAARNYIPAAVPSGAAAHWQEARYPAGTLGDIIFKLSPPTGQSKS